MERSTWPKRQCCPQGLASVLSGPLQRTAKARLEGGGIRIDISSIFIEVSQGKKPSACPGLLVPEGCFAVVSHRSSLVPEAQARASDLSLLPCHALPSQHAEQADSVHMHKSLALFKTNKGFWARWVDRHDHAERMHRGEKGLHRQTVGKKRELTGCFRRLLCPVGSAAALLLLLWLNRFFSPSSIVRRGFRLFFSISKITAYSRSAAENEFFSILSILF